MTLAMRPAWRVARRQAVTSLRLATINISGPSVDRARQLLPHLSHFDADVLVLTETRRNAGTAQLIEGLAEQGYRAANYDITLSGERGVAVLDRTSAAGTARFVDTVDLPHRLVTVALTNLPTPITVVGTYVPSRDASETKIARKRRFLEQLITEVSSLAARGNVVLLGDLNIISRTHQPRYSAFKSWEYEALERLGSCGLVDAYAQLHPDLQPHSWIGRTGAGYQYDYAYISQRLAPSVLQCEYRHELRSLGLTDHAAVVMTVAVEPLELA